MDRTGEMENGPRETKSKSQRVQRTAVFYEDYITSRTEPGTDRRTVQRHAHPRTTSSDAITIPMASSRSDSTCKSKSLPRSSTVPAFTTSGQPRHQLKKGGVGERAKFFESMIQSEDGTSAARTTAMKKPASMNYGQYSHDPQKCQRPIWKRSLPPSQSRQSNKGERKEQTKAVASGHISQVWTSLHSGDIVSVGQEILNTIEGYSLDCVTKPELDETRHQLNEREILISVSGRHNVGKSTILNAILKDKLLPTSREDETTVRILIENVDSLHGAVCSKEKGSCESCPVLVAKEGTHGRMTSLAEGSTNIRLKLKDINEEARGSSAKVASRYVLRARVPLLSSASSRMKVCLVDNAGFGEANQEEITTHAQASMKFSSAYVYIMDYTALADKEDTEAFKIIHKQDHDVFTEERMVLVVTKYDHYYTSDEPDTELSVSSVKEKVRKTLTASVGASLPHECIIVIMGHWAYIARDLLVHQDDDLKKRLVEKRLADYQSMGACGQGESQGSGFLGAVEVAKKLEEASKIKELEDRIQRMTEHCHVTWANKMYNDCDGYIRKARAVFMDEKEKLEQQTIALGEKVSDWERKKEAVECSRETIGKKLAGDGSSQVHSEMMETFDHDVQEAMEKAKGDIDAAMSEFQKECYGKLSRARITYKPKVFKEEIERFLSTTCQQILMSLISQTRFTKLDSCKTRCLLQAQKEIDELIGDVKALGQKQGSKNKRSVLEVKSVSNSELSSLLESRKHPVSATVEELEKAGKISLPHLQWLKKIGIKIREFLGRAIQVLSEGHISGALKPVRDHLLDELRDYFNHIKPEIVKLYFSGYVESVEAYVEVYDREWKPMIHAMQDTELDTWKQQIEDAEKRCGNLKSRITKLDGLQQKLKSAVENELRTQTTSV